MHAAELESVFLLVRHDGKQEAKTEEGAWLGFSPLVVLKGTSGFGTSHSGCDTDKIS